MTRPSVALEPTPSSEVDREPATTPGQAAEQLAERVKADAREHASTYLRDTVVPEGGE